MTACKLVLIALISAGLALPGLVARPPVAIYKGAIVMDAGTGEILFADHADEVSPPASMAKLMTFAVVDDQIRDGRLSLATPIHINRDDARVAEQGDSTHVGLRAGETFTVEELIYAIMIQSANDAAFALARSTAGSVPAFVDLMNAKARALGMTRTVFRSPNGFPPRSRRVADGDLTTPRDFALLARYLVRHTDVVKYTRVRSRPFGAGVRFPPTPMNNHNRLLGKIAGLDGLKTGFTGGAGFCLTATAERAGRRIIVVVMDSPDARDRDLKVAQLIERGFAIHPFHAVIGAPASAPAPTSPPPTALVPASPGPAAADPNSPAIHFAPP
jgi:D-alanyl-D-alanine carboxypeptidase (penicillin-binding protein 5/6)